MEMNHDLSQSGNSPVIFITRDSLEVSGHVLFFLFRFFVLFFFPVIIVVFFLFFFSHPVDGLHSDTRIPTVLKRSKIETSHGRKPL